MVRRRRSRRPPFALLALAGAVAIAACGTEAERGGEAATESAAPPAKAPNDLPEPLAANRAQANEIIDGSTKALEAKLEELRGFPVVVNQWGSWCPPCRAEFPFFAESAEAHAKEVAFVGVDIQDSGEAAEDFLEEFPTPYPHVFDQDSDAVFSIGWTGVSPTTWFVDERGEIVYQRPGAYPDRETLEADIERHLLRG
jgi:thiol-disulfide isomerase/thioredoxin